MSTGRRQVQFPLPAGSLSELRVWASAWVTKHDSAVDCDAVALVMTEMVTNSALHWLRAGHRRPGEPSKR